jgi:hypothetical protein
MGVDVPPEWDQIDNPNYHGLGVSDPIKSVEVRAQWFILEQV